MQFMELSEKNNLILNLGLSQNPPPFSKKNCDFQRKDSFQHFPSFSNKTFPTYI